VEVVKDGEIRLLIRCDNITFTGRILETIGAFSSSPKNPGGKEKENRKKTLTSVFSASFSLGSGKLQILLGQPLFRIRR
jgi:hypothetical protein